MTFSFRGIGEIRESDVYIGYRVSLSANYPPMAVPLKLDITTGDQITPKEIEYQFKLLFKLQYANIEPDALKAALNVTTEKRGSSAVVKEYRSIMDTVKSSEVMQRQWENYQKDFEYATGIAFEDACDVVVELMDELTKIEKNESNGGCNDDKFR